VLNSANILRLDRLWATQSSCRFSDLVTALFSFRSDYECIAFSPCYQGRQGQTGRLVGGHHTLL